MERPFTQSYYTYSGTGNIVASPTITSPYCASCAVSSDGNIVVILDAGSTGNLIYVAKVYVSTDRGNTFSTYTIGDAYTDPNVGAIAVSDNIGDVYIYAVLKAGIMVGKMTSSSTSVVWNEMVSIPNAKCFTAKCSSTGQYVLCPVYTYGIYYSNNYGVNFTLFGTVNTVSKRLSIGGTTGYTIRAVGMSKDGSKGYVSTQNDELPSYNFYYNNYLYVPPVSAPASSTTFTAISLIPSIFSGAVGSIGLCMTYSGNRVYESFYNTYNSYNVLTRTYPFATTPILLSSQTYTTIPSRPAHIFCNYDASVMKLYANGGGSKKLYQSVDFGFSWQSTATLNGPSDFASISCDSSCNLTFMVGSNYALYTYSGTGNSIVLSAAIPAGNCMACGVSSDGRIVAVLTRGLINASVYVSIDSGATFTVYNVGAAYTTAVGAISISDNSGDVYIYAVIKSGIAVGKLSSGYTSSSQVIFTLYLTAKNIYSFGLACSGTGQYVLAAAYEYGILYSKNYGVSFNTYNASIDSYRCAVISKSGARGYVSTQVSSNMYHFNNYLV